MRQPTRPLGLHDPGCGLPAPTRPSPPGQGVHAWPTAPLPLLWTAASHPPDSRKTGKELHPDPPDTNPTCEISVFTTHALLTYYPPFNPRFPVILAVKPEGVLQHCRRCSTFTAPGGFR